MGQTDIGDALDRLATARLHHQVAAIASELWALVRRDGREAMEVASADLKAMFADAVDKKGMTDIANHQAAYAIRLAGSPGDLLYEEMHKLFSLADELHALQAMGCAVSTATAAAFEARVRERIRRQSAMARSVARDRVDSMSRDLWWYGEAL